MREYQGMDQDAGGQYPVYHVSGCCFLMNRKAAETLYPLDENTFLYDEELIIGIRDGTGGTADMVLWDRGCGTSSWIHDTEK